MRRILPYTTAALLALNSPVLYSAEPAEARKLADYAIKHGVHRVYNEFGHKIDSHSLSFKIREGTEDELNKLEIRISRLLVDDREVLTLTGNVFVPTNGEYMRIQLDDGGLEKNLPLDGNVDTVEIAFSEDDGKTFHQTPVPESIEENRQYIFDIYVGKLLKKIR